ncbi:DUF2637 domain-containing protein [Streptomyces jumonjinensis]|uniref:DUF2637 domain-containing protein n=1 Tax=Streptomyces jumonjinensis TaxID=1945 RepID=UPI003787D447
MSTTFYEERRKDRSAERDADRADRKAEREAELAERAADREEAKRLRRERDRDRARLRAERKAARGELLARLRSEGDTVGSVIAMACSVIPALYFQLRALMGEGSLPGFIALCLAVMLESGAWVATVAGERAKREGRPVGVFRAAMWGCATFAAAINYSHAPGPSWLAWVLAASSYGGVGFWELRGYGRHKTKASRTRAQRREERLRRKHDRKRRRKFPKVYARYTDLLTAAPYGSLDSETAWRDAWRDIHRAELGVTAGVLAHRVAADKALSAAVSGAETSPESAAVELLLADLFGPGDGDADGSSGPSGPGPDDGPDSPPAGGHGSANSLGRKGKRPSGRTAPKTPGKPLTEADLDTVRALAKTLGGTANLSASVVRRAIGGGSSEYIVRLRDAVKAERQTARSAAARSTTGKKESSS